jgi:hypothetical protein
MKAGDKCPECKEGILQDELPVETLKRLGVLSYVICLSCMTGFMQPIKSVDVIKLNFVVGGFK